MSGNHQDPHIVFSVGLRWTPPPNWPEAPEGWTPSPDWRPDPLWGPPPPGWAFLRLSDCAADANLPLEYRNADIDANFRQHIQDPTLPAASFLGFLENIVDLVTATFKVTGEVARVGSGYRDQALRSTQDATDVLARAQQDGKAPPFLFFACMQDALSAVQMFALAADRSVDDGLKEANLAAFSSTEEDREAVEKEAGEKFQTLFDNTFARVMSLLKQGLERATAPGGRGRRAREVTLREYEVVNRLVARVGAGRIGLKDGLAVIDELNNSGRRIAAALGTTY